MIWFNLNMKMENSAICQTSYTEACIVCIIDEDVSFRSRDSLFNLDIKTNFQEYNWINIVYLKNRKL